MKSVAQKYLKLKWEGLFDLKGPQNRIQRRGDRHVGDIQRQNHGLINPDAYRMHNAGRYIVEPDINSCLTTSRNEVRTFYPHVKPDSAGQLRLSLNAD